MDPFVGIVNNRLFIRRHESRGEAQEEAQQSRVSRVESHTDCGRNMIINRIYTQMNWFQLVAEDVVEEVVNLGKKLQISNPLFITR